MKKIVVEKAKGETMLQPPGAPDGRKMDTIAVLPADTPSGERVTIGRTFELVFSLTI